MSAGSYKKLTWCNQNTCLRVIGIFAFCLVRDDRPRSSTPPFCHHHRSAITIAPITMIHVPAWYRRLKSAKYGARTEPSCRTSG